MASGSSELGCALCFEFLIMRRGLRSFGLASDLFGISKGSAVTRPLKRYLDVTEGRLGGSIGGYVRSHDH